VNSQQCKCIFIFMGVKEWRDNTKLAGRLSSGVLRAFKTLDEVSHTAIVKCSCLLNIAIICFKRTFAFKLEDSMILSGRVYVFYL
jgi:hypothetical protein